MEIRRANLARVDDDERLREKVDEAMSVYNEYVTGKGTDADVAGTPKMEESTAEGEPDESKA